MTDLDLLAFGCGVLFIAVAGGYVFARERFVYSKRPPREPIEEQLEDRPVRRDTVREG